MIYNVIVYCKTYVSIVQWISWRIDSLGLKKNNTIYCLKISKDCKIVIITLTLLFDTFNVIALTFLYSIWEHWIKFCDYLQFYIVTKQTKTTIPLPARVHGKTKNADAAWENTCNKWLCQTSYEACFTLRIVWRGSQCKFYQIVSWKHIHSVSLYKQNIAAKLFKIIIKRIRYCLNKTYILVIILHV